MSPALTNPFLAAGLIPSDLPNLFVWVRSDLGVYSDAGITPAVADDPVAQWNDLSGNNRHMTDMGDATRRPIYKAGVLGSYPALRFDASNDLLRTAATLGLPNTCFIVYNHRGASAAARRALAGGNNWLIGPYAGQHSFYGGGGFVANTDAPVVQFQFVVGACRQGPTPGAGGKFWLNAVDKTDAPGNSTSGPGTNLGLAANNPFAEPLDGDILEAAVYNDEKPDVDVAKVFGYFQSRYGLW